MPSITSVTPNPNQVGVVIGATISISFDSLMDHSTISEASFSMAAPGATQILTPDQYISSNPSTMQAIGYITGTYTFDDTSGVTIFTFNPSQPLKPNTTYQLLMLGGDGIVSTDFVKDINGDALTQSYQWSFQTGILALATPPISSPLPPNNPAIDPNKIRILINPRKKLIGNDLVQEIDVVFPSPIDPTFDVSTLLLSLDAVIGDPSVIVPPNLTTEAVVDGNKIRITITGW